MEKKLPFHSSGESSNVTIDTGGAFSIWFSITPQKSFCYGVMIHWPNFTLVLAKLYPKLLVIGELQNFLICIGTNYHELKPFLEMVLCSSACLLTD